MKVLNMITTKIKDLYQILYITPKEEWTNYVQAFFESRVLKQELIEKALEEAKEAEWRSEVIEAVMEGAPEDQAYAWKKMLECQYDWCKTYLDDTHHNANVEGFIKILVPLVRRMLPQLTILKLIGCQPMAGPVGLAYKLRYREEEREEQEKKKETPAGFLEGTQGKKLSLEVVSQAVEARTQRLSAGWSIEATEDVTKIHGINIEAEMIQALAHEIAFEMNNEYINIMRRVGIEQKVKINGDDFAITIRINQACSAIAQTTRRGAGNWIVISPTMLARIQAAVAGKGIYETAKDEPKTGSVLLAGVLNSSIKVYVDMYSPDDQILVGYKGNNGETDTGIAYCPYVPVMSSGVVINPHTFEPVVSMMTRNGVSTDEVSQNFYRNIIIEDLADFGDEE